MYDYGYGYDYGTVANDAMGMTTSLFGIMGGLMLVMGIFTCIISLISIISYAKIFSKAGKPWWASIVPIYNIIVMLEIAKLPVWYIALFFVPIANIYALFKINIEMAKKFGKGTGFGVGMTLLSVIFIPLLAFSDNKYEDSIVTAENFNNEFDASKVINSSSDDIVMSSNATDIAVAPIAMAPMQNEINAPVVETEAIINNVSSDTPFPVETVPVQNVEPVEVAPVVEATPVQSVEPIETIQMESVPNAFNIAPEVAPIETMNVVENAVPEQLNVNSTINDLASNVAEDKKICKNCGNELPDIVSICPNCGTDNE